MEKIDKFIIDEVFYSLHFQHSGLMRKSKDLIFFGPPNDMNFCWNYMCGAVRAYYDCGVVWWLVHFDNNGFQ